jgi:hypothetical protein
MFFAGEDELAVHTVASAAYRIISDLKKKRGRDEAADYYLTAIFYVVRDYRRGTLPRHFTDDPDAMKCIRDLAEHLPVTESTNYQDVKASISIETARNWWSKRNMVSNFLKHADRDIKTSISLDEVDNLLLLVQALASYGDLVKNGLGQEGLILWTYFNVVTGTKELLPQQYQEMARKLEELDAAGQLRFCSFVLGEVHE